VKPLPLFASSLSSFAFLALLPSFAAGLSSFALAAAPFAAGLALGSGLVSVAFFFGLAPAVVATALPSEPPS